jgi:N-acetylmuramoyl-L-alanine amidase
MQLARLIACFEALALSIGLASDLRVPNQNRKSAPVLPVRAETTAKINQFVIDYYEALSHRDLDRVLEAFDNNVDYLGGERTKDYVRNDLSMYVSRWQMMTFEPEDIVIARIDEHRFRVHFNLSYTVQNAASHNSGISHWVWVLRQNGGTFQISSQKEVANEEVGGTSASKLPEESPRIDEEEQGDIDAAPSSSPAIVKRALSVEEPQVDIYSANHAAAAKRAPSPGQALVRLSAPPKSPLSPPSKRNVKSQDFAVALDVGHSKHRGGAISAHGVFEYQFNRRLVGELFTLLQAKGFTHSFIINPDGADIRLIERSEEANDRAADLFLAIHHDSVKDSFLKDWTVNGKTEKYCDQFHGYSVFFSRKNAEAAESRTFALELGQALLDAGFTPTLHHVEQEHRPIVDPKRGVYAFDDLIVLKGAKMPAVLLECGVIVNREEEDELNTKDYRRRIIDAIEAAIAKFAGEADVSKKPRQGPTKSGTN